MLHETIGDHELYRLALAEGRTEGDALLRVTRRKLDAALSDAETAASLINADRRRSSLRQAHALTFLADKFAAGTVRLRRQARR